MKNKNNLVIYVLTLFTLLVVLVVFLLTRSQSESGRVRDSESTEEVVENIRNNSGDIVWEEYKNEEYGFSLTKPPLLDEDEHKNEEGYLYFIRFEENKLSMGKGIAVGITEGGLEREVERVAEQFEREFDIRPEVEEETDIDGRRAVRIEYKKSSGLEPRVIIFLEKENMTYSISTTPEQIERVIETFKFLEE